MVRRGTKLRQDLDGDLPARPRPTDALRVATKRVLEGRPISMSEIATEVGVNRATLHRWVGTRTDLLCEVAVRLVDRSLDGSLAAAPPGLAVERLAWAIGDVVSNVWSAGAIPALFEREGLTAVVQVMDPIGAVRPRIVGIVESHLQEMDDGPAPADIGWMADGVTRLLEVHLWIGSFATVPPDIGALHQQIVALCTLESTVRNQRR